MKALSIRQPDAGMIASGEKTIETRLWATSYRGDLLICSSKKPVDEGPAGVALCIVRLVDCRPMEKREREDMCSSDEIAACCEWYPGAYAWILVDIRPIKPFPVRGQLGLFDVEVPHEDT